MNIDVFMTDVSLSGKNTLLLIRKIAGFLITLTGLGAFIHGPVRCA